MQTSPEIINNIESKEYAVVRLNKDNLKDLARLQAAVYNTAVNEIFFQKKYNTAYTGVEYVGFISYNHNGLPVAYYGVIPCFVHYGDEVMLAAQSADTMTHPQHRYKGMFVELSNKTFGLCRQLGVRLIFGFPNQNSYHGAVNKLGWKMTETMTCFTIPVKSLPLESAFRKTKLLRLYKRYCHFILRKKTLPFQGVSNSVVTDGFAGVYRSSEYLEYKTYCFSNIIEINNSRIWIKLKNGLIVGDMEGIDEKNFSAIMNQLKKIAKQLGLRQLQFHCSPGTKLHQLFIAASESSPSFPVLFQDFGSAIPIEKFKFVFADIDIF